MIPARGGSKRIPRKNIKLFCGKPIIAYTIEAALKSGAFDEVMVSTDDPEIAEIAVQYGAKVPFMRSKENSNDQAGCGSVMEEVLREYQKIGVEVENLFMLYSAAPFITPEKLQEMVALFENPDIVAAKMVARFSSAPQQARVIRDGSLEWVTPSYYGIRTQDLEPMYYDCGQAYGYRAGMFMGVPYTGTIEAPIIVSEMEHQDIDCEEDWEIAEFKYQYLKKKGKV